MNPLKIFFLSTLLLGEIYSEPYNYYPHLFKKSRAQTTTKNKCKVSIKINRLKN